jgi:hypothetical protein
MSLTLNTVPARIDSSGTFNVTTSLVEDSTHVNLRVRADVYFEGVIKATVELPKGLSDFDLSGILKSLVVGIKLAKDSGSQVIYGTKGSELITSWSVNDGTYTTFTHSGNQITSAICTVNSSLISNAISMVPGELYVLSSYDFVNTGTRPLAWLNAGGAKEELLYENIAIIIMPTTTASIAIRLGGVTSQNFSGTFHLYKITTNRITTGNPLTPYFVNFTEVYESATGVTTTGATAKSCLYRFVPATIVPFSDYVLSGATSKFSNLTLRSSYTKFFTYVPKEYFVLFFTEYAHLQAYYSIDGAGFLSGITDDCLEGWGMFIINIGELMSTVVSLLEITVNSQGVTPASIAEHFSIYKDNSQNDDRVILEFTGTTGGKEYLALEGKTDVNYETMREYYKTVSGVKKPLVFTGFATHKMETLFKDMANAAYLKTLLLATDVKKLNASYVDIEATVVTTEVKTNEGRALFTNAIEIQYDE